MTKSVFHLGCLCGGQCRTATRKFWAGEGHTVTLTMPITVPPGVIARAKGRA